MLSVILSTSFLFFLASYPLHYSKPWFYGLFGTFGGAGADGALGGAGDAPGGGGADGAPGGAGDAPGGGGAAGAPGGAAGTPGGAGAADSDRTNGSPQNGHFLGKMPCVGNIVLSQLSHFAGMIPASTSAGLKHMVPPS
jgi:hypothetical protein